MLPGIDDLLDGGGNLGNIKGRVRPEKKDIWKVIAWVVGIMTVIVLYVFEVKHLLKTFNLSSMALIAMLLGAIAGAALGYSVSGNTKTSLERMQIIIMITVFGALAMPLFASLSNRLLGSEVQNEKVEFTKLDPIMEAKFDMPTELKPDAYFLYFVRNQEIEKLKVREPHYKGTKRGARIDLPIIKGLWGYDVAQLK